MRTTETNDGGLVFLRLQGFSSPATGLYNFLR
jgi:hypothetical protein